ncbi:MAG: hypothetical protein H7288_12830 [Kineosporiaceae bacterium]|nr:hypothetical protein [Aeromicrobium sp.]
MFTKLATAFVFIFALSVCSSGVGLPSAKDSPSASSPRSAGSTGVPSTPPCINIWEEGSVLPRSYKGCVSDGKPGAEESANCQDGTSLMVFEEAFYAVTGAKIRKSAVSPLQDTEEYSKAFTACTGE